MSPLRCVIVDDEPLARECIQNYIRELAFMELVSSCSNPLELSQTLQKEKLDLIFIDIQMPLMSGIDFLRQNQQLPSVIIITAFPSYALEGFELSVLDYLLKPITFNRFVQAATKARDYHTLKTSLDSGNNSAAVSEDYFFIKCEQKFERIYFADILFVQALQNYVIITTTQGRFVSLLYLKTVSAYLAGKPFVRVHKSYLVSINHISAIEQGEIRIKEHRIPLSRTYRQSVLEQVVGTKLWKK